MSISKPSLKPASKRQIKAAEPMRSERPPSRPLLFQSRLQFFANDHWGVRLTALCVETILFALTLGAVLTYGPKLLRLLG
jgi:hypothetical protein